MPGSRQMSHFEHFQGDSLYLAELVQGVPEHLTCVMGLKTSKAHEAMAGAPRSSQLLNSRSRAEVRTHLAPRVGMPDDCPGSP